jgi:hypothetical protein
MSDLALLEHDSLVSDSIFTESRQDRDPDGIVDGAGNETLVVGGSASGYNIVAEGRYGKIYAMRRM